MALAPKKETTNPGCAEWLTWWSTPCPAIDRAGEACWRDTPLKAGQARMQVSIPVNVVGLLAGFKGNVPALFA